MTLLLPDPELLCFPDIVCNPGRTPNTPLPCEPGHTAFRKDAESRSIFRTYFHYLGPGLFNGLYAKPLIPKAKSV
jgi:hypothetical protein